MKRNTMQYALNPNRVLDGCGPSGDLGKESTGSAAAAAGPSMRRTNRRWLLITALALVVGSNLDNGYASEFLAKRQTVPKELSLANSGKAQVIPDFAATAQAKMEKAAKYPKLVQRLEARLIKAWEQATAEGVQRSVASLEASGVRLEGGNVIVIVECSKESAPKDVASLIAGKKGIVIRTGESHVKAAVPVTALEDIASNIPGVTLVRTPIQPRQKNTVKTEGLAATMASTWHAAGFTGQGAKIAIIDSGFFGLASRKAGDEIPASAVEVDYSGLGMSAGTDGHGCACAEIIYDMAPGCQMYLIKVSDNSDLEAAKNYCKAEGIQIASYSLGYDCLNFHDGTAPSSITPHPVAIANDANANGILWVNAAGNEQRQHAMAAWRDGNANNFLDWLPATSYRSYNELFNGGGTVPVGKTIDGFLTWNEWPVTDQDFDLRLYYWNGSSWTLLAVAEDYQTGTQSPYESLSYTVTTAGTLVEDYAFFIAKASATRSPTFILRTYPYELFFYGYNNYSNPAPGSICIPADAVSSFAVGAIDVANYTIGPIESFSSLGPNNGAYTGNPTVVKPDVCGPDYISTVNYGTGSYGGTSASTPHIAGLAALVKGRYPTYSNTQLKNYLQNRGVDLGTAGKDNTYGYGPVVMPTLSSATVTLGNLAQTYTGTGRAITATTTPSGLTVDLTYNGSASAPTNVGSYTVIGTINDSTYYGSATNTLVVSKGSVVPVLSNLAQTYNGTARIVTASTTPPGLTVDLTYNSASSAPTNAGSYTVIGTINNTNYQGSATNTLVVSKASILPVLGNLAQTYNGTARIVTATTTPPGLTVDLTYNGAPSAPTNAGSYTVIGTVNNTNYQGSATNTLVVSKAVALPVLGSLAQTYNGAARIVNATTTPSGLTVSVTYNGAASAPTNAGSYTVIGTVNNTNYQGSATNTLVVSKAIALPVLGSLAQTYNGTARIVTATTTPSGLTVNLTYNGVLNAPTNVGSYTVIGTVNNINYQGSATNTLVVACPAILLSPAAVAVSNRAFHFSFSNAPGVGFEARASTNVRLPWSNWISVGPTVENPPGRYRFSDSAVTNTGSKFYRVRQQQ